MNLGEKLVITEDTDELDEPQFHINRTAIGSLLNFYTGTRPDLSHVVTICDELRIYCDAD